MRMLALIALALLPFGAQAGERDGPPPDRLPMILPDASGGWHAIDRLIVNGMSYDLPGEPATISHERIDISRVPVIGDYTGAVLGPEDFGPGNAVGEVQVDRRMLILHVDRDLEGLPVSVFAELPRHGRVEFRLDARRQMGRMAGINIGETIGTVHLVSLGGQRRLVAVVGTISPRLIE